MLTFNQLSLSRFLQLKQDCRRGYNFIDGCGIQKNSSCCMRRFITNLETFMRSTGLSQSISCPNFIVWHVVSFHHTNYKNVNYYEYNDHKVSLLKNVEIRIFRYIFTLRVFLEYWWIGNSLLFFTFQLFLYHITPNNF